MDSAEYQKRRERAEYMRKWRATNPAYREYRNEYLAENRERILAQRKEYYAANREAEIAATRARQKSDPWLFKLQKTVHFANHRYPGKLTVQQLQELIEKSGRKCCWCGKENLEGRDLTLEHLRPSNNIEDLAIACWSCNGSRRTKGLTSRSAERRKKAREDRLRWLATLSPQDKELRRIRQIVVAANRRYPGALTVDQYREIAEKSGGKCYWCSIPLEAPKMTLDHLEPTNDPSQLVIACRSCNSKKLGCGKRTDEAVLAHRTAERVVPTPYIEEERAARKLEATRAWRKRHPERVLELGAKYRDKNRELFNKRASQWKKDHVEQVAEYRKRHNIEHREEVTAAARDYRRRNPDRVKAWKQAWNEANRGKVLEQKRESYVRNKETAQAYRKENRDRINASRREGYAKKRALAKAASA